MDIFMLWLESTDDEARHILMGTWSTLSGAMEAGQKYGGPKDAWENDGSDYWYLGGKTWIEKAELH